ncbi:DUF3574 domain-containing protein [Luteimonas marina]|uniref:DUF3574 domain-containing protein n=1 Tax=Luteimonas marina TaxID=488485 RepID=A0A5C5U3T8_9GAMM|nr:DUF3574 domain-containing protein [Luteimonas marina]TWT20155.1 DUF3574 domain-containing protein [Luteimonas marina]
MPAHRSPSVRAALAATLLLLAGCASPGAERATAPTATAALHGDAARPAQASGWVRSELYFGVGRDGEAADPGRIDEARWRDFLDREVTARFPDGLTVFDAYGQWLFRGNAEPERLDSKVLVILHEDTPQRRADIETIRLAWKQATGHQSVLWSRQAVEVSF